MPFRTDTLPPPLMTSEPGSFARKTIVERKPQILYEVSRAYPYPPDIQSALVAFTDEIASGPIRSLSEDTPDAALWNGVWAEYEGRTWLDVPWYFAETFFYRRLMEVVRFYQPGPWQDVDPFAPQKATELERALPAFLSILAQTYPDPQTAFTLMVHDALWGNRADLSNRTISAMADEGLLDRQSDRLLIDDTPCIWHYLAGAPVDHGGPLGRGGPVGRGDPVGRGGSVNCGDPVGRVDIVTDNSGLELALDLRLADFLLQNGLALQVRFHLKRMPFFVSDAMIRDLDHTLDRLEGSPTPGSALAVRLRQAIADGRFTLRDDPFWSTCLSYHQMPAHVQQELAGSDLLLFKGDVSYRRLLDDRHWPHTAHLADIAGHLPAPFVALRTLKGELIVDLQSGQAEALAADDPTWMINGQRGLVQFVDTVRHDG